MLKTHFHTLPQQKTDTILHSALSLFMNNHR